jgi:hypothetical protein
VCAPQQALQQLADVLPYNSTVTDIEQLAISHYQSHALAYFCILTTISVFQNEHTSRIIFVLQLFPRRNSNKKLQEHFIDVLYSEVPLKYTQSVRSFDWK